MIFIGIRRALQTASAFRLSVPLMRPVRLSRDRQAVLGSGRVCEDQVSASRLLPGCWGPGRASLSRCRQWRSLQPSGPRFGLGGWFSAHSVGGEPACSGAAAANGGNRLQRPRPGLPAPHTGPGAPPHHQPPSPLPPDSTTSGTRHRRAVCGG